MGLGTKTPSFDSTLKKKKNKEIFLSGNHTLSHSLRERGQRPRALCTPTQILLRSQSNRQLEINPKNMEINLLTPVHPLVANPLFTVEHRTTKMMHLGISGTVSSPEEEFRI